METKPCVLCGRDVTFDDSVVSMVDGGLLDESHPDHSSNWDGIANVCPNYIDESHWWIGAKLPAGYAYGYADVIAIHIPGGCSNE